MPLLLRRPAISGKDGRIGKLASTSLVRDWVWDLGENGFRFSISSGPASSSSVLSELQKSSEGSISTSSKPTMSGNRSAACLNQSTYIISIGIHISVYIKYTYRYKFHVNGYLSLPVLIIWSQFKGIVIVIIVQKGRWSPIERMKAILTKSILFPIRINDSSHCIMSNHSIIRDNYGLSYESPTVRAGKAASVR